MSSRHSVDALCARSQIPHRTIEIFNEKLRPRMSEADVISLLSLATDFEQIIPRDSEEAELKKMLENAPCEVKDGTVTSPGKVNILLQGYVSRVYVEDFALVSDSAYVAQNAGRIIRALLEIALSRKWAPVTSALMAMSKAVERRMWPFDHPLAQSSLSPDTIFNLTRWADEVEISELANMSAADLGEMIHLNERLGGFVRQAARQFPALRIEHALRPLTHDLLRIVIDVSRAFEWKERMHGGLEPFYVWIEDEAGIEILQWANVLFRPHTSTTTLSFVVPISKPQPRWLSIRWISDRWLGSEDSIPLRLDSLIMPAPPSPHLALLDLPLLPISALQDPVLSALYSQKLAAFNALQTQCFHTLMHSRANTLLCGPTASGKSTIAQMAIWRALRKDGNASVLVMHPHRILARRAADQFRNLFGDQMGLRVRLVSTAHEMDELSKSSTTRTVVFATPLVLGRTGKSGKSLGNALDGVALIIAEDLHLLDPAYELALSRLCQQALESGSESGATRIVGTSASLHDATGLAAWLGVKEASIYSFHPKDRPSMLQTNFQSFDFAHSIALLKTMVKPTYDRIKSTAISGPAIVFVPSRMQCLSTAADLITRSASEMDTEAFMGAPSQDLEPYLQNLRDGTLREPLMHGIGVYHEGMAQRDQLLILQLFEQGIIHVIIAPREACWSLPVRAHLVVIMGTQYVRLLSSASAGANANANANANAVADRKVTDYALTEVARMQSLAIRAGTPSSPSPPGECLVLCQADQVDYLCRMLTGGLPLESALLDDECEALLAPLLADIASDKVDTRSKAVEELSWTYLSRQLERNPSYYDCEKPDGEYTSARLSRAVDAVFETLLKLACIRPVEENDKGSRGGQRIAVTDLGKRLVDQNRPGAVVRLAELCVRLSADPAQAGVLFKGFENTSGVFTSSRGDAEKEKEQKVEQVGIDVLAATRDRIPGEWLAAFVIPKAARAGKDKSQSQIKGKGKATSSHKDQEHPVEKGKPESDGTTGGNDNASANASINGKDERDANDGSTQLKGTPTERRAILLAAYFSGKPIYTPAESASIQSSRGGSKGKGKDQGADTEAAISDNASSVQANGRPKNDLYERERESLRRRQGELVGKMLDALEGPGPAPAGSGVVRRNGEAPKIARREGASSRR